MRLMRKILAALLVTVLLTSVAALAETYVKFTGDAVGYKRAGSRKTDVVVKKGSVSYTEKDSIGKKWTKLFVDEDTELWFKSSLLKKTDDDEMKVMFVSGGNGRSTFDEDDDENISAYKTGKKYVYATGKCNIRKSPSLEGKRLGTFKKGTQLKYLGKRAEDDRGVHWYKVKTSGGKTGWVSEAYAKLK